MPRIIPMKDLRNTNEILDMCKQSDDPIFVTKNGYGELVVMSMDTYETLATQNTIDTRIAKYELDKTNNIEGKDASQVFNELKETYLGDPSR